MLNFKSRKVLHISKYTIALNVNVTISGIRMLDQPYMTDLIEANSMGHEPNLIDIYSASWGPTDDGRTVDGPRNATMRAIVRGVNEVPMLIHCSYSQRPYHVESTSSRPITEVKQRWAQLVLGRKSAWELWVLLAYIL